MHLPRQRAPDSAAAVVVVTGETAVAEEAVTVAVTVPAAVAAMVVGEAAFEVVAAGPVATAVAAAVKCVALCAVGTALPPFRSQAFLVRSKS